MLVTEQCVELGLGVFALDADLRRYQFKHGLAVALRRFDAARPAGSATPA